MPATINKDSAVPSLAMGRVVLTVHDLAGVRDYYQAAVGLHLLQSDGEVALLGVGRDVLLELRTDRHARRRSPGEAGLFHTAFLLPGRRELGSWVRFAIEKQIQVAGVADHLVSEAIYLNDPEGNGIEIYRDRRPDEWRWTDGKVAMANEALDVEGLVANGQGQPWQGVPEGSVVGHVHLQVGTLDTAEAFYRDALGLDVTCYYPGAVFYAADGYHHHVATNIWNSRGAGMRSFPSTGLTAVDMKMSPERAAGLKARQGSAIVEDGEGFTLQDPWGTPIRIRTLG